MLTNYFTTALRNLTRNKGFSLITILGLALGLSCVFLITYYVSVELSFDKHHEHADNIYRVIWATDNPQTRTPHPLAQAMVSDFKEVEQGVSLSPLWGVGLTREIFSFHNLDKDIRYDESSGLSVDTTFFDVFTVPFVYGNPKTALKNTGGILISESMAARYFGNENPLGKQLAVNEGRHLIEVVAVYKDFPYTSHMHADFIVSYLREKALEDPSSAYFTWADFGHYNYIRVKPGTDVKELEGRMLDWLQKYFPISNEQIQGLKSSNYGFQLQPITDIHLKSHVRWELEPNGYMEYVYILMAAAILILVIGCVNFINLTTAQSAERAREIGVRKSLGATKGQLAFQFTGESVIVSLMATLVAGFFIEVGSSWFTLATGQPMKMNYAYIFLGLGGLGLLTGIVAGIFPSLYLSSLKPGLILKGTHMPGGGSSIRSAFTVFQFFASMVLISASLIIYRQLDFIQSRELGFNKDQVISIPIKDRDVVTPKVNELRTELLKVPGVTAVSASSNVPGRSFNQNAVFAANDPQLRVTASEAMVDYAFFDVMGIGITEGRSFTLANPADTAAFMVNETLARNLYGDESAVGREIVWDAESGLVRGTIIGVVKDFHFQSLHKAVDPLFFRLEPSYNFVVLNVTGQGLTATIKGIEKAWRLIDNEFSFDYSFLSEDMSRQYAEEQSMGNVLAAFSAIAVAIACFGLLGIAALTFRHRTKEVSVRKVLGASRPNLMLMLLGSFSRMIIVSVLFAVPLVWWVMNQWLQNFTFRMDMHPLLFIIPGIVLLVFAWGTLSYLTWKVSNVNPAETLRRE